MKNLCASLLPFFDEEQSSQYGKTAYAYGDQAEVV